MPPACAQLCGQPDDDEQRQQRRADSPQELPAGSGRRCTHPAESRRSRPSRKAMSPSARRITRPQRPRLPSRYAAKREARGWRRPEADARHGAAGNPSDETESPALSRRPGDVPLMDPRSPQPAAPHARASAARDEVRSKRTSASPITVPARNVITTSAFALSVQSTSAGGCGGSPARWPSTRSASRTMPPRAAGTAGTRENRTKQASVVALSADDGKVGRLLEKRAAFQIDLRHAAGIS